MAWMLTGDRLHAMCDVAAVVLPKKQQSKDMRLCGHAALPVCMDLHHTHVILHSIFMELLPSNYCPGVSALAGVTSQPFPPQLHTCRPPRPLIGL